MNQSNVLDLVAKLLATENLNIYRKNVSKSKFDLKTRTLTIPLWNGLSNDAETVLLAQEVGHAIYSTDKLDSLVGSDKLLKQYSSIVDDIRVEKLLKRKYPGIAKNFANGYVDLAKKGFFKGFNPNEANLIDKINMYNKLGYESGVSFNEDESSLLSRVNACSSEQDVYDAAVAILEYSKQSNKDTTNDESNDESDGEPSDKPNPDLSNETKRDLRPEESGSSDGEGEQKEDSDGDEEDGDSEGELEATASSTKSDEELESKTYDSMENSQKFINTNDEIVYCTIDENISKDRIISYKTIIDELNITNSNSHNFNKFYVDMNSTVSYLTKEFEMRKNAQQLKRAAVSKSGALDMRKLYAYKLKDELFKSVTSLPNGKNHGMLFLLDWSGSMTDILDDTIEQLLPLVLFCRKNQIKHKVLAFTDEYKNVKIEPHRRDRANKLSNGVLRNELAKFSLLEFFSDSMTNAEFKAMAARLHKTKTVTSKSNYQLGGTPLTSALGFMSVYIGDYIRETRVEKMSLITLTDGASDMTGIHDNANHRGLATHILKDDRTKKEYRFSDNDSSLQTYAVSNLIKDRYDMSTIGFFISSDRIMTASDYSYLQRRHSLSNYYTSKKFKPLSEVNDLINKNGFFPLENTAMSEFFVIPSKSLSNKSTSLDVNFSMSQEEISDAYVGQMSSKIKSKILLNRFVELIA